MRRCWINNESGSGFVWINTDSDRMTAVVIFRADSSGYYYCVSLPTECHSCSLDMLSCCKVLWHNTMQQQNVVYM